jgi:prepilin-type N-terminal cleavage/methylation domain-containing protein
MKGNSMKFGIIRKVSGFTLMEVLIGIVIFAIGMMALAQLQGNLARNSTDSNARTVATNIAEEVIEAARTFSQIDSDGTNAAYNDIVSGERLMTRGGNKFKVVSAVTDYYYQPDGSFSTTAPPDAARSDFKRLTLTVTWNPNQEFQIDKENTTTGRLGTGSITITDVISSITSPSGGKVALGSTGDDSYAPPVNYNPGQNPDIVSIQLGANKFKESTTPLPDVIRTDELVETTFDVVTYSQSEQGATFLRREEFRAVSCECTLRIPDADGEGGRRPTLWEGYDYTEGEWVSKPFGESANNIQSNFCDICCRDHHDGGTGENDETSDPGRSRFNPFRPSEDYHSAGQLAGDHKHYGRNQQGELVLAETDGASYIEACRLVRKDGFFRVAQDLRQEAMNAFPGDYLDEEAEVSQYSDYVTAAVTHFEMEIGASDRYELNPPYLVDAANLGIIPDELDLIFPASTYENPTDLPTWDGATEQQLRSRGVYVDYMSDVLRARINCMDAGGSGENCEVPEANSALEIIPFYDVQLTWLSRWNESPSNNPVDVTNEAVANDNSHDRGMASLQLGFGYSTVSSAAHKGNLGLTASDPIDPKYASEEETVNLYVLAVDYNSPPSTGPVIAGSILSAVAGVRAADVEIEPTDAQCDRTNTGYKCAIESFAINPRLKVYNYNKPNMILVACSADFTIHGQEHVSDNGTGNWTRFNLPSVELEGADIIIKENSCSG